MFNLGDAQGRISIDTSRLERNRQIAVAAAQRMGDGIKRSFESATRAGRSLEQQLERTNNALKSIQGELQATTLAGAALTGFGLRAADNVTQLQIRFEELTGSQQAARDLMQEIADAATRVGLPVRQTQADFAGLVPAIRDAGGEVETYLNLVSRLSTLNRQEGVSGAVFAIREALTSGGTDLVSLAERFNIPRQALRDLIEETGSFSEALDILLDKQGATTALAEAGANSLAAAMNRLRDSATRTLERAYLPQLQSAIALTDSLANALNRTPDILVEIGGAAVTASAGIATLALGLGNMLTTLRNIKEAAASMPVASRRVARAGVAAGSIAVGTGIGIAGVRAAGAISGNDRLRNFGLDDVAQTLKQILGIIVAGINEGVKFVLRALGSLANQLEIQQARVGLALIGLKESFAGAQVAIGQFISRIADLLPVGGDRLRALGAGVSASGESATSALADERTRLNQQLSAAQSANSDPFANLINDLDAATLSILEMLQPVQELEEGITLGDRAMQGLNRVQRQYNDILNQQRQRVQDQLALIDDQISAEQEYIALAREATVDDVQRRLQALEDERQALNSVVPQLERLAAFSGEAAEKLEEVRGRLAGVNADYERTMTEVLPQAVARAQAQLQTEIADIQRESAQRQAEIQRELQRDLEAAQTDRDQSLAELRTETTQAELEATRDRQKSLEDLQVDHRRKLEQINRQYDVAEQQAIQDRNAVALDAARQRRDEARDEESERVKEQREDIDDRYNEQIQTVNERLRDQQRVINQRYSEQVRTAQQAAQAAIATEQRKAQSEIRLKQQAAQAELSALSQFASAGAQTMGQFAQSGVGSVNAFVQGALSQLNQLRAAAGARQQQSTLQRYASGISNLFSRAIRPSSSSSSLRMDVSGATNQQVAATSRSQAMRVFSNVLGRLGVR